MKEEIRTVFVMVAMAVVAVSVVAALVFVFSYTRVLCLQATKDRAAIEAALLCGRS